MTSVVFKCIPGLPLCAQFCQRAALLQCHAWRLSIPFLTWKRLCLVSIIPAYEPGKDLHLFALLIKSKVNYLKFEVSFFIKFALKFTCI